MANNAIPDALKFVVTDYAFPPECCQCNTKLGDSSLKIKATIGGKGRFYVNKTFEVPICSDCLEDFKKDIKVSERKIIRPAFRVFLVSVVVMIVSRVLDAAHLFGEVPGILFPLALIFVAVPALFTIGLVKLNSEFRELNKTVLIGPGGCIFKNKDYQARVKAVTETYVPRGL